MGRWDGTVLAVRIGRLMSLLIGAVTIWSTWQLANLILPANKRGFALLSAGFVALNPQFLAISGSINNDNLVIALSCSALLLLLRWHAAKEKKAAAPFWIGCLIGLALLSKISGLALGAVVAWVLLWQLFESRHFGSVIKDGLILTAGVLTTAGWWLWRNQTLYGDPLGFGALRFAHSGTYRDEPLSAAEALSESTLLLKTFWLFPGNGTLFGPNWFYWIVNLLVLFGLLSLAILWSKSSPKVASQGRVLSPLIVWLVIILLLLFYWISTVGATSQGR
ncbi:MAG: glycosyltransferase family 39 protein, partial [Chloroflexota bacterium]